MGKTNDFKKLIQSMLKSKCKNTYHKVADDKNIYPHIVFNIDSVDLGDLSRDDLIIDIDLWDKSVSTAEIDDLADEVEKLFNNENVPQDTILPTFFLINRNRVEDEDKNIQHINIRVQAQNYER